MIGGLKNKKELILLESNQRKSSTGVQAKVSIKETKA
jgi:hypothetical protein